MVYDVIIVGGGIVGCAIARELARYRLRVILLEKEPDVGFGTTKANSGVIHAGHHTSPHTLKGRLEWAGNQLWDALAAALDFGFRRCGELTVAFGDDDLNFLTHLLEQGAAKGVPGLELWDRDRLRREEPAISQQALAAVYAPTAGVVNPYEACFRLMESARRNGVRIVVGAAVERITPVADRLLVEATGLSVVGRFVVNAAGLYADAIAALAGACTFSITPRRGEEYLLDKRLAGLVGRVIFPVPTPVSKGILVIPTVDGTLMIGPTADPVADKRDTDTTAAGATVVFEHVQALVPAISERDCISEFAGLRAVSDTNDFIIGMSPVRGLLNVAGIQSPGLTAAPAIARLVVDLLADAGLSLEPNHAFIPDLPSALHFARLSLDEQARLSTRDAAGSRIICRCELVTEREIVDAVQRGACTLDGVKLRTRAGMGRCQGGYCSWRALQLMARELGVPVTALTKHGGNSWLVRERDAQEWRAQ